MTELMEYQDVIDRVRSGFAGVEYSRPGPERPRRRISRRVTMAIASAALIVLVGALVLGPSRGTSLVWAAEPEVVTEADIEVATEACQESLDASDPSLDVRVGDLPPLVLMDLRGDRAVATFRGGGEYVVCLLDTTVDPWGASIFSAAPYGTEESGTPPLMEDAQILDAGPWGEGDEMVTLFTGAVPASVARVIFVFTVPDLPPAEASVGEGAFSIWWPGGPWFDVDTRAYAADGSELPDSIIGGFSTGPASPQP
jgi:hypothetical protein